ncbi:nucleoside triphosphate pyrophosphohydrolase [Chlamydiales bacterium]|nr:nucleoside triphosphate pyrophosphohydrolase [Chlamydiales bacterium]
MSKLVRDKIPEIITNKGDTAIGYIADENEYKRRLVDKLLEEAKEFHEAESIEELADVLEVIDALYEAFNFTRDEVLKIQKHKHLERGGFKARYILKEVTQKK